MKDKPVEVAVEVPVPNEEYEKKLKEFEQQKEQAEKEIAKLKAEINTGKQLESPEKVKFKILLTAAYDSVQRAVKFIQTVDSSQNRELNPQNHKLNKLTIQPLKNGAFFILYENEKFPHLRLAQNVVYAIIKI